MTKRVDTGSIRRDLFVTEHHEFGHTDWKTKVEISRRHLNYFLGRS